MDIDGMHKMGDMACVGALVGFLSIAAQAVAEEFVSQYTSADVRKCKKISEPAEPSAAWVCKGVAGYLVWVGDSDWRARVSVGRSVKAAEHERAAEQFLPSVNVASRTVEWRSVKGGAKPFAIIQRWHILDPEDRDKDAKPRTRDVLIVTRLPPGGVCHVAYIDATANREANVLARQAADGIARNFDCANDKVGVIGDRGPAIEIIGNP